jgi:hypothetical protein
MTDEPLIVRVVCSGPLLGSRTVTPAWFISAEECERAADEWAVTAAWIAGKIAVLDQSLDENMSATKGER